MESLENRAGGGSANVIAVTRLQEFDRAPNTAGKLKLASIITGALLGVAAVATVVAGLVAIYAHTANVIDLKEQALYGVIAGGVILVASPTVAGLLIAKDIFGQKGRAWGSVETKPGIKEELRDALPLKTVSELSLNQQKMEGISHVPKDVKNDAVRWHKEIYVEDSDGTIKPLSSTKLEREEGIVKLHSAVAEITQDEIGSEGVQDCLRAVNQTVFVDAMLVLNTKGLSFRGVANTEKDGFEMTNPFTGKSEKMAKLTVVRRNPENTGWVVEVQQVGQVMKKGAMEPEGYVLIHITIDQASNTTTTRISPVLDDVPPWTAKFD